MKNRKSRPAFAALNVVFARFGSVNEYENAVENLMIATRHLRRGEMGLEVEVGNNFDGLQISIDGPAALVQEFLPHVSDAGFTVVKLIPHKSIMAVAA